MVQVKLRGQVTPSDVEELTRIYRATQRLTVGLHPTAPASVHLTAILGVTRKTLREWTGEDVDYSI